MAEVYLIGQIIGASEFPDKTLFCKWGISFGNNWKLISGKKEGQTQVDSPVYDKLTVWSHPIDVHFATRGVQGWPKLYLQVYHYDKFGRGEIYGYGFINIPMSPGTHSIDCHTWRPLGGMHDEFTRQFLGGGPQLKSPDLVYTGLDRYRLHTEAMGCVHIELSVILRNFDKYGIEA
ncbi:hypothetical protein WDU94_008314 [Cyamophila willieti]